MFQSPVSFEAMSTGKVVILRILNGLYFAFSMLVLRWNFQEQRSPAPAEINVLAIVRPILFHFYAP